MKSTSYCMILFLLSTAFTFGQDKCKYEKNETDDFTGKKHIVVKPRIYSSNSTFDSQFKLKLEDGQYKLWAYFEIAGNQADQLSISKEQELIMLLNNSETVKLVPVESRDGKTLTINGILYKYEFQISNDYLIDSTQIDKFKSNELKAVRVNYTKSNGEKRSVDYKAEKDKMNILQEMINCIENSN